MSKKFTTLNCFLLSFIINLAFLFILSIFKGNIEFKSEDKFIVELTPSQKLMNFRNQSNDISNNDDLISYGFGQEADRRYLSSITYRSIIREVAPMMQDKKIIDKLKDISPEDLFYVKQLRNKAKKNVNIPEISRNSETSAEKIEELSLNAKSQINKLNGNYNISVIYIDNDSYNISKNILNQLANAMNRWTQVKTRVTNERLRLDDPKILKVPMIYIAMRKPFTFSESMRHNLRKYLSQGGFLMFSNIADSQKESLEVANSFGFELWNILGDYAHRLIEIEKNHPIYNCLFNTQNSSLPEILAISKEGRIFVIYEDTGYGKAWSEGINNNTESFMKMGINIIVYMLITSEIFIN